MTITEWLGRFMCPNQCMCCHKVFGGFDCDAPLCDECYDQVVSRILDAPSKKQLEYVDKCYYHFNYNSWYAKRMIRHVKYVSSKASLNFFGKCIFESIKNHNLYGNIDAITYTPRRPSEVRLFTFDQSKELAEAASLASGIPRGDYLIRQGFAHAQKKMSAEQRRENVKGKYKCISDVTGKRILLIDDVMTTGSTIDECARLLKANGATAVYAWTVTQ